MLTEQERDRRLIEWNNTTADYPQEKCIHQLFEEQVEKTPDAIAVVFEDQQLTYRELNSRANQLARYLQGLGVEPEVLVGLCVERSLDTIVALLAILKAGGAYVPLDPTYPKERLTFMLEDAAFPVLLTQERFIEKLPPSAANVVCLDRDWEAIAALDAENYFADVTPDNLAYINYTSGSTGTPKGVKIIHRGVIRLLFGVNYVSLSAAEKLLHAAPISFDASTFEIWGALLHGGECVLLPVKVPTSQDLSDTIQKYKVTTLFLTTALFNSIIDDRPEALWGIRQLLTGGEGISIKHILKAQSALPSVQIIHVYGPTESTTFTCYYPIPRLQESVETIPIGRPIANTQVYLLDEHLQPVEIGALGELHIGGAGLAQGYLNRSELTTEKFIPNPFRDEPSSRLYKTGDLARYLPDGNIEFIGRIDNQVKIRGFRIELGEIEAVLSQHPAVGQVVANATEELANKRLVAYVVPDSDDSTNTNEDDRVREWGYLWDEAYKKPAQDWDSALHIGGWNDSYTGKTIPEIEVQEWVEETVKRILSLQPKRVLEIGCGTGMLLFRIAPQCQHYYGTDVAAEGVRYIEQQVRGSSLAPVVKLRATPADKLEGIESRFDTVVINSVIAMFPNMDYLVRVLENLVNKVEPGGAIWLGDTMSGPLLPAFHTSVQLYQAPKSLSTVELRHRIKERIARDKRLNIEPGFFTALKKHLPQISHVEMQLKPGRYQNELTCFRYDVVLHIGKKAATKATEPLYLQWQQDSPTIADVQKQLLETLPEMLVVTRIPNAKVWKDIKAIEQLASPDCPKTVGELRSRIQQAGIEPEDWYELSSEIPYDVQTTWLGDGADGYYDAIFVRHDTNIIVDRATLATQEKDVKSWNAYANQPYTGSKQEQLVPQLRAFLQDKLPNYMIPSAFVILDELPLTPNGKVDRRALPAPDKKSRTLLDVEIVAPRTPTEEILLSIWTAVLGLTEVGVLDNFFLLGGDSIQATKLMSRVRDTFKIELSLHRLFEAPTVAEFSEELFMARADRQQLPPIQALGQDGDRPLSFAEQRLWFLDQLQESSLTYSPYNELEGLRLSGSLQVEVLLMAIQEIVRRHESLRTNFKAIDGSPVREIVPKLNLNMPIVDLQHLPQEERLGQVQHLAQEEIQQPFDLAKDPLIRVTLLQLAADDYVLLLTMHHIICDGWSMGVFYHELEVLYKALILGKPSSLPPLAIQYADFACWQGQPATSEVLAPQLSYWKQQLAGVPPLLELPTDYPRPTVQTSRGGKEFFGLGVELTEQLKRLSQNSGVTLFMTLLAAFSTLLYRYSGQEDIVVGTPIANRNRTEIEGLIGFFVNTLVLRSRFEDNPSFVELLNRVRQTSLDAYAHQDLPFEQLVEALQPERSLSHGPIFQVMFALQNAPMEPLELPGVSSNWLQMEIAKPKFDLFLSTEETEAGLTGYWEYNRDLFEPGTIRRAIGHFKTLLEAIVTNPEVRVGELPLLTTSERHQLLVEWNETFAEYPQDKCIHQLFEEQVERTPDAVAVVFEEEKLTYRELNAKANQLAHTLQSLGVGADAIAGICVERSLSTIVGLLGILKAGGAYLPLDPTYPAERIADILADAGLSVLLTTEKVVERLPQSQTRVICLDTAWEAIAKESEGNLPISSTVHNLAYVIYTSGSAGKPKGVEIEHRSVLNLARAMEEAIAATSDEPLCKITLNGPLFFDTSVKQIVQLLYGRTLYIVPENIRLDSRRLLSYLQDCQIDLFDCTPSQLRLLVADGFLNSDTPPKYVLVGGEAIDESTWTALKQAKSRQFYNLYGPTECTVDATLCALGKTGDTPTIGRPISNTQIYILDNYLQPVPIGVPGELHIGGAGLARGYLNRPELTKQKFIPNPFSDEPPGGSRLYKTGDKARYLPDGNIEFIARIDNQVKIRGFRIELGEIEATLSEHPEVREAVVIVREDIPGDKRLLAYIVPEAEELGAIVLRSFLKSKLPDYMVPSAFVFLEAIPLTANGKIDRRALPAPDTENLSESASLIPPRSNTELQLCQIWSEVLNVSPVGVTNNFFDLGGHSLLAVRLMARIESQLGIHLPLATLFTEPTIESQAQVLNAKSDVRSHSHAVPIQGQGELPPFFCVHPVGGNVLCYAELARHLGKNQPFYGFQSPGLSGEKEPLSKIEEMATIYIEALQEIQPCGPYYLGGWSMGGVVAWEMAQQLQLQGQEVALLALIDSYAPNTAYLKEEIDEASLANSLAADLGGIFGLELPISASDIQQLQRSEQLQHILTTAKRRNLLPPFVGIEQMRQLFEVFKANRIAYAHYQPKPYSGRVVQFCASSPEEDRGWSSLVTGELETYLIPGDHYGMMQQPHVRVLADRLGACLN